MSTLADMGLSFVFDYLGFLYVLFVIYSVCLDLFGCFGFFGFAMVFDLFRCTLDSSKRLGRG